MNPVRQKIMETVESFPVVRTIDVNLRDLICQVKLKSFAYWFEDGLTSPEIALRIQEPRRSELLSSRQSMFFKPTPKSWAKWLGVSPELEWIELELLLREAYIATAPKSLVKQFAERAGP